MILYAESLEEIFGDKIIAIALRPHRVKNRDLKYYIYEESKMGKKEFEEYITSNTKGESKGIDAAKELAEWRAYLNKLYDNIVYIWMKDYISKGMVQVARKTKQYMRNF